VFFSVNTLRRTKIQLWNISCKMANMSSLVRNFYMFSPFSDINPCHSLFLIGIICGPGMLHALQAFARLCKTLYRRQFRKKSCSKEFVETLFQASLTCSQERCFTDDFELYYGTLQAGNWTKHNEKQANNARRTAGELLGHFPRKIRFVFRSKPSPRKTHRRRNAAMFKITMTSQSRVSVSFLALKCAVILETFS